MSDREVAPEVLRLVEQRMRDADPEPEEQERAYLSHAAARFSEGFAIVARWLAQRDL